MSPVGDSRQPIKIAFCITDLDPGGAEWALFHIVSRLDKQKWSPQVYCLSEGGELVEKFEQHSIPVTCLGAKNSRDFRIFPRLTKELKAFSPLIVQGFLFHGNIASRIAGYRAKIPIRLAGHRVAEREKKWHLKIDRATKFLIHHHICVSFGVAEFIKNKLKLNEELISVISNGIDVTQVAPQTNQIREELGLSKATRIVLSVGRLHPQKGFDILLEAFSQIQSQLDDTHLLLVGDGPQQLILKELVEKLNLEERVTLTGFRSDITELMSEARIYVLSSRWEGMPNVLLQAMQCRLPIVATDVEGVAELISDRKSGLIVKPSSANDLGQAILELINDDSASREYAGNAQAVLKEEFTWDKISREYDSLYSQLIAELEIPVSAVS